MIDETAKPPANLAAGEPYHFHHQARLPSDDYLRPMTLPGCVTPITVSHRLELDVAFRRPGDAI